MKKIILQMLLGIVGVSLAYAAPVASVESAAAKPALQKIDTFLSETAVVAQLAKLGLTPAQAQARLAKLNDAQLAQLAACVDQLQAGGDIESGNPHPLGPIGCFFKRIADTIGNFFRFLFCWTDTPSPTS